MRYFLFGLVLVLSSCGKNPATKKPYNPFVDKKAPEAPQLLDAGLTDDTMHEADSHSVHIHDHPLTPEAVNFIQRVEAPKTARINHALYQDMPTPLGFTLCDTECIASPSVDLLYYSGKLSIANTTSFYLKEMERAGWDIMNLSHDQEGLLCCTRPKQYCTISIRPNVHKSKQVPGKTLALIFIKKKPIS